MPSREKFAIRRACGDFRGLGEVRWPLPFVMSVRWGEGMSTVNLSRDMEKCLPPPVAEVGEASGELDIADEPDDSSGVVFIDDTLDSG
jgi:hypothetical protein